MSNSVPISRPFKDITEGMGGGSASGGGIAGLAAGIDWGKLAKKLLEEDDGKGREATTASGGELSGAKGKDVATTDDGDTIPDKYVHEGEVEGEGDSSVSDDGNTIDADFSDISDADMKKIASMPPDKKGTDLLKWLITAGITGVGIKALMSNRDGKKNEGDNGIEPFSSNGYGKVRK